MLTQQPLIVADAVEDPQGIFIPDWMAAEEFRGHYVIPLLAEGRAIGAMAVDMRRPRPAAEDDVRLLQLMATQAALALETARLQEESLRQERLAEQLEVARQIQLSLLPDDAPEVPGWDFAADVPARADRRRRLLRLLLPARAAAAHGRGDRRRGGQRRACRTVHGAQPDGDSDERAGRPAACRSPHPGQHDHPRRQQVGHVPHRVLCHVRPRFRPHDHCQCRPQPALLVAGRTPAMVRKCVHVASSWARSRRSRSRSGRRCWIWGMRFCSTRTA